MELAKPKNNRIKAIQAEFDYTDQQMGDALGIGKKYYQQKILGRKPWTRTDIEIIQALSGKSFDYIYGLI